MSAAIPAMDRRQALLALGASVVGLLAARFEVKAATQTPFCPTTPAQAEGPYFTDDALKRSDIRLDPSDGSTQAGVPLVLTLHVNTDGVNGCEPLANARVDIWHCNAQGIYSDVNDPHFSTLGKKYLRGYQLTDVQGRVQFTTIYPGWYPGRTVHIHVKVRVENTEDAYTELTTQLYFNDALTDQVFKQPPYSQREERFPRNEADGIFRSGGKKLMLALTSEGQGYHGHINLTLPRAI